MTLKQAGVAVAIGITLDGLWRLAFGEWPSFGWAFAFGVASGTWVLLLGVFLLSRRRA